MTLDNYLDIDYDDDMDYDDYDYEDPMDPDEYDSFRGHARIIGALADDAGFDCGQPGL